MEHIEPSAAELTAAIRRGDADVFSHLVQEHQRSVFFMALRMTRGDEPFARDIVQKSFLAAWRHRKSFRGEASFRTWLLRIAHNECLNELGRAWRKRESGIIEEDAVPVPESRGENPLDLLVRGEARELLVEAVASLSTRQRSVAMLRLYQDLSFKEIADVTGITVNNAKVNFHHAVRNIRQFLANQGVAA